MGRFKIKIMTIIRIKLQLGVNLPVQTITLVTIYTNSHNKQLIYQ